MSEGPSVPLHPLSVLFLRARQYASLLEQVRPMVFPSSTLFHMTEYCSVYRAKAEADRIVRQLIRLVRESQLTCFLEQKNRGKRKMPATTESPSASPAPEEASSAQPDAKKVKTEAESAYQKEMDKMNNNSLKDSSGHRPMVK